MKPYLLLAATCAAAQCLAGDLPNPHLTPGAIDPRVTQANIGTTVCVRGYTKSVRPPVYYTNKLKKQQIREYGYRDTNPKNFQEDHLVPLSVGGHPTDPRNLWPEPRHSEWGAEKKDQLEFALYKAVCRGDVRLEDARNAFATNWIDAYKKYESLRTKYRYGHREGFED
jgi:hypothetical protein